MTNNAKDTIIAFVRLLCMAATAAASMANIALDADAVYTIASIVLYVAATIWGWWKNNNVTKAASDAHEFVELFKNTEPRCDMDGE